MFTGIVTDVGTVRSAQPQGDLRLTVECSYDLDSVDLGASIACSGVCLTVVDKGGDWFAVDVSQETISRTAPGMWAEGAGLNLERALRVGDELGGHIVTGHVDGTAEVLGLCDAGGSKRIGLAVSIELGRSIAPKGSVTVDGVSLTVNDVEEVEDRTHFSVNIIPHTSTHTTLGSLTQGQHCNIEIDVLARYLQRMTKLLPHQNDRVALPNHI
jgi:riboflavin synthase